MKYYDISVTISPTMPVWPGDPGISIERTSSLDRGDPANVSMIRMGTHTGTHIDAPFHFLKNGRTVDLIPPDALVGPCLVIETDAERIIEKENLPEIRPGRHQRVLFRTRNSLLWKEGNTVFDKNFVSLGLSAAEQLAAAGVTLVGVDYLSVEAFGSTGHLVHRFLLERNMVIVEGLDLSSVPAGEYELVCLPLKIAGSDGAPARALLIGDR